MSDRQRPGTPSFSGHEPRSYPPFEKKSKQRNKVRRKRFDPKSFGRYSWRRLGRVDKRTGERAIVDPWEWKPTQKPAFKRAFKSHKRNKQSRLSRKKNRATA